MKRKDCAYCIDLDEQGALCDHPLHLDCGEPVDARCSSRCAYYERRISIAEALSRIHDLEAKLAESEKWRSAYADMVIPLKVENERLKTLVRHMHMCTEHIEGFGVYYDCDDCVLDGTRECDFEERMRELGIEVNHE